MAVVTSQLLTNILTNTRAIFKAGFDRSKAIQGWMEFTTKIPNAKATEQLSWFGAVPQMALFKGQMQFGDLGNFSYSRTNELYKAGFELERLAIERDALGQLGPRTGGLAREAASHPGRLIMQLFESPGTAFDGTAFFSDTHTIGAATIDNEHEVTSAGAVPTPAELRTYLAGVRNKMRQFQDDKGVVMGLVPDTLVIPGQIESAMLQALTGSDISGTGDVVPKVTDNGVMMVGSYKVIVNPFLTDVNDWYALHTREEIKPFLFTEEITPSVEMVTDPNSEAGIIRDRFPISVRASYAVGVGHPAHAVKVVDAGS